MYFGLQEKKDEDEKTKDFLGKKTKKKNMMPRNPVFSFLDLGGRKNRKLSSTAVVAKLQREN